MPEQDQKKRKQGGRGGGRGGGGGRCGGDGGEKPNKKAKFFPSKPGTGQAIPLSSQGILVTCDATREDRAGDEAVALIEEHYDKLAAAAPKSSAQEPAAAAAAAPAPDGGKPEAAAEGSTDAAAADGKQDEQPAKDDAAGSAAADGGGGGKAGGGGGGSKDIAALLAEEVAQLKDRKAARFRVHNTGVKGCIFVIFPADAPQGAGPVEVARSIAQEAQDRKQVRGRHIVRFLPVTLACFANLEEIKAAAPKLLASHFPDGEGAAAVEYSVDYEHRSAEGFDRMAVIDAFTAAIKSPPHKVNLKTPDKVILVQLIRNGCGMAVVEGYRDLAKFNVRKLVEVEEAA